MNTSDLLEQLLRAGQGSMTQQGGGAPQGGMGGGLGGLLGGLLGGGGGANAGLGGLLGGLLGGGSAMGGATQPRSGGGTNYAALASLGMMAFRRIRPGKAARQPRRNRRRAPWICSPARKSRTTATRSCAH